MSNIVTESKLNRYFLTYIIMSLLSKVLRTVFMIISKTSWLDVQLDIIGMKALTNHIENIRADQLERLPKCIKR